MDFETLKNQPIEVIKEYLDEPEKLEGMNLKFSQVAELIKIIGAAEELFSNQEKLEAIYEYVTDLDTISDDEATSIIIDLIKSTGNAEKYLTNNEMIDTWGWAMFIIAADKVSEYLTPEKIKELGINSRDVNDLIIATGNIEKYLTPEKIEEYKLDNYDIRRLIIATGDIEKYLIPEKIEEYRLDNYDITRLIIATGDIEKYLTPEKIKEYRLNNPCVIDLIKATGNIEKYLFEGQDIDKDKYLIGIANIIKATGNIEAYLTSEKIKEYGLDKGNIINLIKATENIEEYLTPEKIKEYGLDSYNITDLIKATGNVEKYLTPEKINEFGLRQWEISSLIKITSNVEKYLFEGQDIDKDSYLIGIANIIKATGDIEGYLTPELIKNYGLNSTAITNLIKATGNAEKYLFEGQDIDKNGYSIGIANIIKATGDIEGCLTPELIKNYGLSNSDITNLIKATGNAEKYLFEGQDIDKNRYSIGIANIIKATGDLEGYLTPEKVKEYGLNSKDITDLIKETGKIEAYLTPERIKEYGLNSDDITNLIKKAGNIEKYLFDGENINDLYYSFSIANIMKVTGNIEAYLTPEKVKEYGLNSTDITRLIKLSGNIEKYLLEGQDIDDKYLSIDITNIIKASGNIEAYLTLEKVNEYKFNSYEITKLIKETGNVEKYLFDWQNSTDEYLSLNKANIIKAMGRNIEEYLTIEKINEYDLNGDDITDLIKATRNIESYLTPEIVKEYGFNSYDIVDLIKVTENIEAYLTPEKVWEYGLNKDNITTLINASEDVEKYLIDKFDKSGTFDICNVLKATTWPELDKEDAKTLRSFDTETIKIISTLDKDKRKAAVKILDRLERSNSAELRRIKEVMALQILEKDPEKYEETLNIIEDIYLTSNVPDVGKLYLVFQELHLNFLGEESEKQDASYAEIPSLSEASVGERKQIIFSKLLRCAFESNNRDLRDYLEIIENGNETFEKIKNGEISFESLSESERKDLEKYSGILNTLYNQTTKGRRGEVKRENTGDVQKDLEELENLFNNSRIKLSLPDRMVRTFCYGTGIRTFEEAKNLLEDSRKKAEERNEKLAATGKIILEEGDFIKGVVNTEYFPSMLQRGILAKDFLGGNATSDCTPLDTDVEKIVNVGDTFEKTLNRLNIARSYTDSTVDGKKLGTIMLVFSKDDFIETRNSDRVINKENVKLLNQNKDKKEVICNFGSAYGISMGIGSENIKCIVADRYVDKLGLEIAMNGFYIPIVDKEGKVIYTKDMYNKFRQKMQGLSHYGETHFELDETAKKAEMREIVEFVDRSMQNARDKQNKILKTLAKAVEENGYELSPERKIDLIPGTIEFVDTGSTGRGTNMPGDGDFDFMVRMDKNLSDNPSKFKDALRKVLRRNRNAKRLHRNNRRWF